ncbi:MAG: acyl-CoA thioesterase [Vicinamibacterales bacterium]|jgi:4-hydroxybenzoyl-CoA thioesterase|nr:thioesterase [Acidobacteriota bacterium]MDP6372281.1 acyl-CoA thioesterase [Vicinamibacterales bacterium]MDP6607662.1 acyl-CoA thioesterase [Vicinamibacterales bacterium]HAK54756.1 acyl-CoA thioesterase [Acidobacteriota bacterium]|tara:strand:+ start:14806 stop:15222 length:417 start_codon:yes stop_codon:yes gene_type:complete
MKHLVQELTVEWAHCDAAGIVFYPYFYTWFDQATERLFSANGLTYPELRTRGILGMPLLESGARYENPCQLGERLTMDTWVDEWQRKTLLVKHRLTHADGRPALEGFERRAWVVDAPDTPRGMRAESIPADVITRFDA